MDDISKKHRAVERGNALRRRLPTHRMYRYYPNRDSLAIIFWNYSCFGEAAGLPCLTVASLTPADGLGLWVASIGLDEALAGLPAVLTKVAFASAGTRHEAKGGLLLCATGLPATRRTGLCATVLAGALAIPFSETIARAMAAVCVGRTTLGAATTGVGAGATGTVATSTAAGGGAGGVTSVTKGFCTGVSTTSFAAGGTGGAGGAKEAVVCITMLDIFGGLIALLLTKTVKTPGASSTVAVPQRLGALSPSRRISSTLKLSLRGCAWQSGFLLTQTWSQGRFPNCLESRAWPCASVSASWR
jgi:hypothetical protein